MAKEKKKKKTNDGIFSIRALKARENRHAHWIVFNMGEDLEFAECSNCGHEVEPIGMTRSYPLICMGCKQKVVLIAAAE